MHVRGASSGISYELGNKNAIARQRRNIDYQERKVCNMENERVSLCIVASYGI